MNSGFLENGMDISPAQSLDGSFRKSSSVISARSLSNTSASSKLISVSRKFSKGLRDYRRKLADLESFTQSIEDWVLENASADSASEKPTFCSPFVLDELYKLDLALEGTLFQQLFRMPCSTFSSNDLSEDEYLALEDFLHGMVTGLWRTFWHKTGPLPFFVSCPRNVGSKFYTVEKTISRGMVGELPGLALISGVGSDHQACWDQVVEFALFKQELFLDAESNLSVGSISEALFYGVHILISRSISKITTNNSDSVFVLVLDPKYGGVVKLGGDVSKLQINMANPYKSAAEWIKNSAEVRVSKVERIWNKLGNANWGDLGTLQLLLATFYSIVQCSGLPRKSVASLASDHSLRLQKRWTECRLNDTEDTLASSKQSRRQHGEIVEVGQNDHVFQKTQASHLKFQLGEILTIDDQRHGRRSFQIQESLVRGNCSCYSAVCVDSPVELLTLYVGAHPSRLEPSWEEMSLWYQVQRQTKVLNIFKKQGITSKYVPELIASGQIQHSGPCEKQTLHGRCDHPSCGTPILVTSLVGEPLSDMVTREGLLPADEAIRCCRDCLAALRTAAMANIQHGDICPENIVYVPEQHGTKNGHFYAPISWGRAVLEDRDSPAINLQFSSSHSLQRGKLCPSSDAESLIYLLFFVCGGSMKQQDSIESALQWREVSWASRLIQQRLGEVSALLKAFADYVDSLHETPYPVDYEIWLKRLDMALDESSSERGKMIEELAITLRQDVAESSGTSCGA